MNNKLFAFFLFIFAFPPVLFCQNNNPFLRCTVKEEIEISLIINDPRSKEIVPVGEKISILPSSGQLTNGYLVILYGSKRRFLSKKYIDHLGFDSLIGEVTLEKIELIGSSFFDIEIPDIDPEFNVQLNASNHLLKERMRPAFMDNVFLNDYLSRILIDCIRIGRFHFASLPKIIPIKDSRISIFSLNDGSILISTGLLVALENEWQFKACILRELLKIHFKYNYAAKKNDADKEKIYDIIKSSSEIMGLNPDLFSLDYFNNSLPQRAQNGLSILQKYGVLNLSYDLDDLYEKFLDVKIKTSYEKEVLVDFGATQILANAQYPPQALVNYLEIVKTNNLYNTKIDVENPIYGIKYINQRLEHLNVFIDDYESNDQYLLETASAFAYSGKLAYNNGNYTEAIKLLEVLQKHKLATSIDIVFLSMSYRSNDHDNGRFEQIIQLIDEAMTKNPISELLLEKAIWLKRVGKYSDASSTLHSYENQLRSEKKNEEQITLEQSEIFLERERMKMSAN